MAVTDDVSFMVTKFALVRRWNMGLNCADSCEVSYLHFHQTLDENRFYLSCSVSLTSLICNTFLIKATR